MEAQDNSHKMPILSETKNGIQFKKVVAKGTHIFEKFLEKLVAENEDDIRCHGVVQVFLLLAVCFTMLVTILTLPLPSTQNPGTTQSDIFNILILFLRFLPIVVVEKWHLKLIENPRNFEYRKNFTDIGAKRKKAIKMYNLMILVYFIISVCVGFTVFDILSMIGQLVVLTLSILVALINTQICTKLRISIRGSEQRYILKRTQMKDTGSIRIIGSSVFKITLINIGSEPWISDNAVLHRHTCDEKEELGWCFKMPLPLLTIMPQQQISLVPEGHQYDEECIRIPGLHCFGTAERDKLVKTTLFEANGENDFQVEYKTIFKSCCGKKVTEHAASYKYIPPPSPTPPPKSAPMIDVWTNVIEK